MNKHVTPLEHGRKTDGSAPRHAEIAREEAFRDLPQAQIGAVNCLVEHHRRTIYRR
jgi:hypothetical protein